MNIRSTVLASSALAITLLLAGCSTTASMGMNHSPSTRSPSSTETGSHNDADVAFAMNMAAHHRPAIEMSDMLLSKTGVDSRVSDLAVKITAAQTPEIDLMTAWLDAWGQPGDMGGMDGMNMNGMMSNDDMDELTSADGPTASKLFLTQMTRHHQGAIDMSQEELATGKNAAARVLATRIIAAQTTEIATMTRLLASL